MFYFYNHRIVIFIPMKFLYYETVVWSCMINVYRDFKIFDEKMKNE